MEPVQILALVVSLAITAVAVALFAKAIGEIVNVVKLGQPAPNRTQDAGARTVNLVKETLGHTRMLQWTRVGAAHWLIMVGFGLLFATLVNAYGQLFDAHFILPVIGHFFFFEWVTEFFAWAMVLAILPFMVYRVTRPKERVRGADGRLYGSTMWQGYFVEWVILTVGICILLLRFLEYGMAQYGDEPGSATAFHFPLTSWIGQAFTGTNEATLANLIWLVAMVKIVISMVWMITLALNTTMGVAWHRFSAWPNIWFKRKADGGTALGALQPMMADGKPIDFEDVDDLDEDTPLGVGKVEDFAWKGILDFTTCTECGRCQSQCPAWNTDKPLSPKLFITNLRDHAYAKAPYLLADPADRDGLPAEVKAEAERALVGATEGDPAMPTGGAVIDPDVLWSCTSCGACVQQCPVDIEHVDHIIDMRRYQVLVESNFPSELNALFKGLENKGNPWNMSPNARLEWAKDLPFEVKVVGEDVESLDEVEWLFWVGCAGAYEDRAKKTTRAVAELLDMAGVSFAVLGNGETCNGDPARRSGNEFVFQQLAMQNAETFKETKAKKVVATCAHCFNTLKNEYPQFGVELEVVHHTQLLNRLVREGRLTPVPSNGAPKKSITYHDPCYLGRHNQVYSPPRELLNVIPNAELKEMPRNSERSFCCGAGGARMWMEEKIGERINLNRTTEAVETGADQIATGCPFCRVMLSDGLTAKQADGSAREEVEVLDVAQLLLASVKRAPAAGASVAAASAAVDGGTTDAGATVAGGVTATALLDRPDDEALQAEPQPGDVTQTESTVSDTEDVGANAAAHEVKDPEVEASAPAPATAPASGGLFDDDEPAPTPAPAKTDSSGLFDDEPAPTPPPPAQPAPASAPDKANGGGLFDDEDGSARAAGLSAKPATSGGLFDDDEPAPAPPASAQPEPAPAATPGGKPAASGGLFEDEEPPPAAPAPAEPAPASAPAKADSGGLFDDEDDAPPVTASGAEPAKDPAQETEIPGGADTDPDSADVTEPEIGEAESTAPDDDAAVRNARIDDDDRLF